MNTSTGPSTAPQSTAEASSSPSSARGPARGALDHGGHPRDVAQGRGEVVEPRVGPKPHWAGSPPPRRTGPPRRPAARRPRRGRGGTRGARPNRSRCASAAANRRSSQARSIAASGSGSSIRAAIREPGLKAAVPMGCRSASSSRATVPGARAPGPAIEHDLVGIGPGKAAPDPAGVDAGLQSDDGTLHRAALAQGARRGKRLARTRRGPGAVSAITYMPDEPSHWETPMPLDSTVEDVTARIRERSSDSRTAYLDRMRRAAGGGARARAPLLRQPGACLCRHGRGGQGRARRRPARPTSGS